MKKIGITTHYFNSKNFGGNLQAFALCDFLNKSGYSAEQICFVFKGYDLLNSLGVSTAKRNFLKRAFSFPKNRIARLFVNKDKNKNKVVLRQEQSFENFNKNIIPHSIEVFNIDNASKCAEKYDAFIAGSDQIWNLSFYNPFFYLEFAGESKLKISYAASIAKSTLLREEIELYKDKTKDFSAISLREQDVVDMLKGKLLVEPQVVVDPVLLLKRDNWDEVCSDRVIKDKYLFCYFLGNNKKARNLAKKFAKINGLKLVNIPYAGGNDFLYHKSFGDIKMYDVGPEQFLSLIKHSDYVFTDSFHAVVFSYVYQKQFFVFNRNSSGVMNSRIYNITKLIGADERFCSTESMLMIEYLLSCADIDYGVERQELLELIEKSKKFLLDNLG